MGFLLGKRMAIENYIPPENRQTIDLQPDMFPGDAPTVDSNGEFDVAMAGVMKGASRVLPNPPNPIKGQGRVLMEGQRLINQKRKKQEELKDTLQVVPLEDKVEVLPNLKIGKRYQVRQTAQKPAAFEAIDTATDGDPIVLGTFVGKGAKGKATQLAKDQYTKVPDPVEVPPVDAVDVEVPPAAATIDADGNVLDGDAGVSPILQLEKQDQTTYKQRLVTGNEDLDVFMQDVRESSEVLNNGMLGRIRAVGTRNGEPDYDNVKIPDQGDVWRSISNTVDLVIKKTEKLAPAELKRISLEETAKLAALHNASPKKMKKIAETLLSGKIEFDLSNPGTLPAFMVAAKEMVVSEIAALDKIVNTAFKRLDEDGANIGPSDKDKVLFMQQSTYVNNLTRSFLGAQSDIARATGAMRIPVKLDKTIDTKQMLELLDRMGGSDNTLQMMGMYRTLDTLEKKAGYTRELTRLKKGGDVAYEIYLSFILSGPWTGVKNIAGITSQLMMHKAETALSGSPLEANAGTFGVLANGLHIAKAAGRAFLTREELYGSNKFDTGQGSRQFQDAFSAEALGVEGNIKGRLINHSASLLTLGHFGGRQLAFGDVGGKVAARNQYLYERAWRDGRTAGKEGEELSEFIADMVHNPSEEIEAAARSHARDITLTGEMTGRGKAWQNALRGDVMRWAVPFFRIAANSLAWVGNRNVLTGYGGAYLGLPLAQKNADDIAAGGARKARAHSRIWLGTSVATTLGVLHELELCTGGISNNKQVRETWDLEGIKPYSCRVGDTWVSYEGLEPLSTLIGFTLNSMEVINRENKIGKSEMEIAAEVVSQLGYALSNKSFMKSLGAILSAVSDPSTYGAKWLKTYLRAMVPSTVKDLENLVDPTQRVKIDLMDAVRERVPGLSSQLAKEYDVFGNVKVSSRFLSEAKKEPLAKELQRLGIALEPASDDYVVPQSERQSLRGDPLTKGIRLPIKVRLLPKERDYLHENAGKLFKENLKELFDENEDYEKLKNFSMKEANTDLQKKFKEEAFARLKRQINKIWRESETEAMEMLIDSNEFGNELEIRIEKAEEEQEEGQEQFDEEIDQ